MRFTLNYIIDSKPNAFGESIIFLAIRADGKRRCFHTNCRIPPAAWDARKQCVKRTHLNHRQLNDYLHTFKDMLSGKIFEFITEDTDIQPGVLFTKIDSIIKTGTTNKITSGNISGFIDSYTVAKSGTTTKGFIVTVDTMKNNLESFIESCIDGTALIDRAFLDSFAEFLRRKNIANNTQNKYLESLLRIMRWLEESGIEIEKNVKFFKKPKAPRPDTIALNSEEFACIVKHPCSTARLSNAQDRFVFQICTGQRVSDIEAYDKRDISDAGDGVRVWKLTQKKTGQRVFVPLPKLAIDILEKRDYELPKISTQKYNDALKDLAKEAGLNRVVSIRRYVGSEIEETKFELWQLVSSHTARRTFISLASESDDLNEIQIMDITGHKKIETAMIYKKGEAKRQSESLNKIFSSIDS